MAVDKKMMNVQIGKRLHEARVNLNETKEKFAEVLEVSDEHYRKLEAGKSMLSADKMFLLHEKYGIDPAYLITGKSSKAAGFDLDSFIANSSKEDRDEFIERFLQYVVKLIK